MTTLLPDRWDALASAIRRLLTSTPERMTDSAERVEREMKLMEAAIKRIAPIDGELPADADEALLADIFRDTPFGDDGDDIGGWRTHVGNEVAALWKALPIAVRYAIARDAAAFAAHVRPG